MHPIAFARYIYSPFAEMPCPEYSGFAGKFKGWSVGGRRYTGTAKKASPIRGTEIGDAALVCPRHQQPGIPAVGRSVAAWFIITLANRSSPFDELRVSGLCPMSCVFVPP